MKFSSKAIAAMAIGVNYDLGSLAVALSPSDTLIEKSNETTIVTPERLIKATKLISSVCVIP